MWTQILRILVAGIALLVLSDGVAQSEPQVWQEKVQPQTQGTFPPIQPFHAKFRFGWAKIEAAEAEASLTMKDGIAMLTIKGGTTGAARALWRLDAEHLTRFRARDFLPLGFSQIEKYSNRTITTLCEFRPDGLWRLRTRTPKGGKSRWRHVRLAPIRDIVSAMFFVRSQRLNPGDKIGVLAYPGGSPFLVELEVLKRETLQMGQSRQAALKIQVRLQKILLEKNQPPVLQAHGKFRRGTVWLSDDANRFPLRAEVDIFVGKVFAELESLSFFPE